MFDFSDLLRLQGLSNQRRILEEIRKQNDASSKRQGPPCPHCGARLAAIGFSKPSKCQHCTGDLEWSGMEVRAARTKKKATPAGPPCPHCGGELPQDGHRKAYKVCLHCRKDLFWHDRAAYPSSEEAEEADRKREALVQKAREENEKAVALKEATYQGCLSACASLGVSRPETPLVIETTAGPLRATLCPLWAPGLTYTFAALLASGFFAQNRFIVTHHELCHLSAIANNFSGLLLTLRIKKSVDMSMRVVGLREKRSLRTDLSAVRSRLTFEERKKQIQTFQLVLRWNLNQPEGNGFRVNRVEFGEEVFGGLSGVENAETLHAISRRCWLSKGRPCAITSFRLG